MQLQTEIHKIEKQNHKKKRCGCSGLTMPIIMSWCRWCRSRWTKTRRKPIDQCTWSSKMMKTLRSRLVWPNREVSLRGKMKPREKDEVLEIKDEEPYQANCLEYGHLVYACPLCRCIEGAGCSSDLLRHEGRRVSWACVTCRFMQNFLQNILYDHKTINNTSSL